MIIDTDVPVVKSKTLTEDLEVLSGAEDFETDDDDDEGEKLLSADSTDSPSLPEGVIEEDDNDDEDAGTLQIYKKICLQCHCLAPFLPKPKRLPDCHFSKNNPLCPAVSVSIQVYYPVDAIKLKFAEAKEAGDVARLADLYRQLSTKPDWIQQRVLKALGS